MRLQETNLVEKKLKIHIQYINSVFEKMKRAYLDNSIDRVVEITVVFNLIYSTPPFETNENLCQIVFSSFHFIALSNMRGTTQNNVFTNIIIKRTSDISSYFPLDGAVHLF